MPSSFNVTNAEINLKISAENGQASLGTVNAFPLYLKTNDEERLTIDQNGNVGIGIDTVPLEIQLRVTGTTQLDTLKVERELQLLHGVTINEISDDEQLSDGSRSAIPSERAVKEYIDAKIKAIQSDYTEVLERRVKQLEDEIAFLRTQSTQLENLSITVEKAQENAEFAKLLANEINERTQEIHFDGGSTIINRNVHPNTEPFFLTIQPDGNVVMHNHNGGYLWSISEIHWTLSGFASILDKIKNILNPILDERQMPEEKIMPEQPIKYPI
ncbi:MAG: hypothetical protein N5P05_004261 (plasmid) [Chroococcopsis gigantea SAG 12.99]|jgi:Zn-finger protein|nr:hypothetical protein [Chroococcopsis gigantea SAG 12.99]